MRPAVPPLAAALGVLLAGLAVLAGCAAPDAGGSMVLATTTSTRDTGLLAFLLPEFEAAHQVEVKVVAVGSGRALELGRAGDADVVLAHAPQSERAYLANGSYLARYEVMYNQFLLVGPAGDPAALATTPDVTAAFARLAEGRAPFVSRGDGSGTHQRERELWAMAGHDLARDIAVPAHAWYRSVGQGMAATLRIAAEQGGYTLSDDGTWYAAAPQDMVVVKQNEPPLHNQYSVLLPAAAPHPLAPDFAAWLVSPATQQRIAGFEVVGHRLFTPNAGVVEPG